MNYEELQTQVEQLETLIKNFQYILAENTARELLNSFAIDESDIIGAEGNTKKQNIHYRIYLALSISLWRNGSANEALAPAEEALSIATIAQDKAAQAKALGNIGIVHMFLSNFTLALEYYREALTEHEKLDNKIEAAKVTANIGVVYKDLQDYTRALEYYSKSLTAHEQLGNKEDAARVNGNIGGLYNDISDHKRAIKYLTKALAGHEELGNKSSIATEYLHIGNAYKGLEDIPHALEYFSKALAISEEIENTSLIAVANAGIGNVYRHLSEYSIALEYNLRALAAFEKLGRKVDVIKIYTNIGLVYKEISDYPLALEYYGKALSGAEELGLPSSAAIATSSIGIIYSERSFNGYNPIKSEELLLKALDMNEKLEAKANLCDVHYRLSDLYKYTNRIAESFEHFVKYHDLEKEILSEEAKKQANIMEQQRQAAEREKEIAIAKAAADAQMSATTTLLHRVLPESIASRIISGEEEIADYFPNVSILFADIKGFTVISADMPAYAVVRFLKFVFGEFDKIMHRHGCEKIKTIGDGYMAVAGAPITCEDHAERITQAAFEMQKTIHLPEEIREHLPDGTKLGVRIGIHTGPVVAGVVGADRFVYDIYSDAVNTASRMESHGEVSRIHVSSDFARHLQNRFMMTKNTTHGITFEKRGEIEIKGKGMMRTFFIEKSN